MVRSLRKDRRWSHDRLAREAGITKQAVINIEKTQEMTARETTLEGIAKAFELTVDELLSLHRRKSRLMTVALPADVAQRLVDEAAAQKMTAAVWAGEVIRRALARPPTGGSGGGRITPRKAVRTANGGLRFEE